MRQLLARIHAASPSPLARDLAGTLKDIVPGNLLRHLRQRQPGHPLALHRAYADLVSGRQFPHRVTWCDGG